MPKFYKKKVKVGLPPGTLVAVEGASAAKITLIDYNEKNFLEKELKSVEDSFQYRNTDTVSWINIDGRDVQTIEKINQHFGIHPLVLEDIINLGQRPKIEEYDEYLFFVLRMIHFGEQNHDIYSEQIGLVLGKNFVISFQEKPGDVFDHVRARIRDAKGRIRQMKGDYLTYALLDAIVDHYFVILEHIGEKIDMLEKQVMKELNPQTPVKIYHLKNEIVYLRKQIWPLREVLSNFQRNESRLIDKTTTIYLRDVYDHTIQVNDTIEALRDALSGIHDIYLSSVSNNMNEIMKVLTIFAAIFIPLTFLVGIYGMNFDYMPELHYRWSYYVFLSVLFILGFSMFLLFKRKRWL